MSRDHDIDAIAAFPALWGSQDPTFVEPRADVYSLPQGRTYRREETVSWYPSEWDQMPPPGCYFAHEIEAAGIPAGRALDLALARSPLVIIEGLAGGGKSLTIRTLCQRRPNMVYIDCSATTTQWRDVHNTVLARGKEVIIVLDSFDDVASSALGDDATRLHIMVKERRVRMIVCTRPFAVDHIPYLAGAPRVFLRSIADPAEPGWRPWIMAWNRAAPRHPLGESEISGLQIEGLVAVPLMHQLFALAKSDIIARYRYDDDLVDALSCDVLEIFFSSHAIDWVDITLLPSAQMAMLGEIAWSLHNRSRLAIAELANLCASYGVHVTEPRDLLRTFERILRCQDDHVQFRQRTFREYLAAWHWSALLAELSHGNTESAVIIESLGAGPLVRPGDRCLEFLARLINDWPPEEHAAFMLSMVQHIAQRMGNITFRYNLACVLSSQHGLFGQSHWQVADADVLRELIEASTLPVALRGIALPQANLSGLVAPRCDFTQVDFSRTRLVAASMERVSFSRANLRGADLSHANLRQANLRNADMRRSQLAKADLRGADLSGADLTDANVSGVLYDSHTLWPDWYNPQRRG